MSGTSLDYLVKTSPHPAAFCVLKNTSAFCVLQNAPCTQSCHALQQASSDSLCEEKTSDAPSNHILPPTMPEKHSPRVSFPCTILAMQILIHISLGRGKTFVSEFERCPAFEGAHNWSDKCSHVHQMEHLYVSTCVHAWVIQIPLSAYQCRRIHSHAPKH